MNALSSRGFTLWNRFFYLPVTALCTILGLFWAVSNPSVWWYPFIWFIASLYFYFWCRQIHYLELRNEGFTISNFWSEIDVPPDSLVSICRGIGTPASLLLTFSPATRFGSKIRILPKVGWFGFRISDIDLCKDRILALKNGFEHASPANRHPFGTSDVLPADPASRAGSTPEASGDS